MFDQKTKHHGLVEVKDDEQSMALSLLSICLLLCLDDQKTVMFGTVTNMD
jgi:hypothetical protein